MERKMRVSLNANWAVLYHYKCKHVATIKTGDDFGRFLGVSVIGKDKSDTHTVIDECLEKEPQDFQEQAQRRMSGCDANQCLNCSSYSSNNFVTVLGKRHQMCGTGIIGYDWREPTQSDIPTIKRLMEIRCQMIDEAQVEKKTKS